MQVLKKRSDFIACSRALRRGTSSMMVQARHRQDGTAVVRVGFTCSKKVGNAVARNRAKRRLRAIARAALPHLGQAGWDYVLIGRAEKTGALPFADLERDFRYAMQHFHNSEAAQ